MPPPPSPTTNLPNVAAAAVDDCALSTLVHSEPRHSPCPGYPRRLLDCPVDAAARQDFINWILRVHSHYNFKPATAFLCVNYFDRFLSRHDTLDMGEGWPFQLLSVACLSIAAKIEEVAVPSLRDLQVLEPKFVFEPGTVQRMEVMVMASLGWSMRAVTPFDYLHCFVTKLSTVSYSNVFSDSSDLIMGTIRAVDFLGFSPSSIAAAAVLLAAGERCGDPSALHRSINKEMVRSCLQLMEEYVVDTCPLARLRVAAGEPETGQLSPVGVLDAAACRSCSTRSEVAPTPSGERRNKRPRLSAEEEVEEEEERRDREDPEPP
ncbi:hypothetical protein MLD38_023287 [Melastoma candidum]|uniref:Uncharacterized protein n=1 Tax=Melastoma candidum TaxID=119954 RepID=A0ACB9QM15_9MYRT|nr:hypothetical protein MLD38_023287 [Melastoma candidum]